jgi:hypothetical protein
MRHSAQYEAVTSGDFELARLLLAHDATVDQESFKEACVTEEFNPPDDRPF